MGELGIILAILCGVWVYAIVNDPTMEPGTVPLTSGLITLGLFGGAIAAGILEIVL